MMTMSRTLLFSAIACSAVASSAHAEGAPPSPAPKPAPLAVPITPRPLSAAAIRGRSDYQRYCAWCHGTDGDGRGPSAHRYETPATDFTRGIYKCRSTATDTPPTDDDLRRSVRHGLDGTGMPSFAAIGPLEVDDLVELLSYGEVATPDETWDLVHYIVSLR